LQIWEALGGPGGTIWGPWDTLWEALEGHLGGQGEPLKAEECSEDVGDSPPESLRGRLPTKKQSKNNGNMKISKNEEKNKVFLNLLRPRK